ncbi:MAG: class II glutamine amidotransferase [Candidatus Bathyarchaeota archaeon]|nr:class II glutamine amidotransferase [Candidatus Bathyarchaeota archaeon]
MCRLLGLIGSGFPFEVFRRFALLARKGHTDGWGVVCFDGCYPRVLGLSDGSILDEMDRYISISREALRMDCRIVVAHIRRASRGSVSIANTQPFVYGRWVFCHNGTINDDVKLDVKLPLNGSSDSERLFKYIVQMIMDGYDLREALKRIHDVIDDYTALNFILSDGGILYVYRDCTVNEDYYTLYYSRGGGYVAVCSEALNCVDGRWIPIENGCLLAIGRDLTLSIDRAV